MSDTPCRDIDDAIKRIAELEAEIVSLWATLQGDLRSNPPRIGMWEDIKELRYDVATDTKRLDGIDLNIIDMTQRHAARGSEHRDLKRRFDDSLVDITALKSKFDAIDAAKSKAELDVEKDRREEKKWFRHWSIDKVLAPIISSAIAIFGYSQFSKTPTPVPQPNNAAIYHDPRRDLPR